MTKKTMCVVLLGVMVFLNSSAFARPMDDQYGRKNWSGGMGQCRGECPIGNKVTMKAGFLLTHKADIGLTDDQVRTIQALKLKIEKDGIGQEAEMKNFILDLDSKLMEDRVDVEATSALSDKAYASASAYAKTNIAAYAQLKSLLAPDQFAKMKALYDQMQANEQLEK